ncbi:MAG: ATP-dependent zinc metalloprotease FtsH [Planctomycetes bacterium]|nr:ATP-dependent zinc metalloprotease FtsH [Planctomycetota bacterium]
MSDPDFNDRQRDEEGQPQGPRLRGLLGWILIGSLTILVIWAVSREFDTTREISRHDLERLLANPDAIKKFYIHGDVLTGEIRAEYLNEFGGTNPDFTVRLQTYEVRPFIERITQNKALLKVFQDEKSRSFRAEDQFLWQTVIYMLPWLFLVMLIWFFVSRQMRSASGPGGVLSFGRSRARLIKKERVKVTFDDVAGIDDAKEEVQEVVQFLKHPEKFQTLGGRIPRGVMLVGPPGSGKTLLAKAIAGEANVPFFSISGSDFVEMFVGVGASRVRDLFRTAKESSPCIIFLDEIDAVGRRRGMGYTGGHDEREQTLNAILVEMDGFETNEQVIIIGATNRPDVLDPALRRPGRFDREVIVSLPDVKEREAILKVHAKKIKLAPHVNLNIVARGTPGFSGADLAAIINESAIHATMLGKSAVEQADLEESRDKVRWGRTKRSRAMDEQERRNIAYHEAGHTLVNILLEPDVEPLHKVSIIPRGLALGATMFLPEKDRYTIFRRQVIGEIKVAFGGRIAEELFVGDISSGAADDIRRATQIARRMVTDWGMSDRLGPIRYASNEETTPWGAEFLAPKEHSDATAREIDQEVQRILGQAYAEAKYLLEHNREALGRIAETLLKKEVMTAGEVRHVIDGLTLEKTVPPA